MDKNRPTSIDGIYRKRVTAYRPINDVRSLDNLKTTPNLNVEPSEPTPPPSNISEKPTNLDSAIPNPITNGPDVQHPGQLQRAKKHRKWSTKRKVLTSALTILVIGFGLGGWYGAKIIGDIDKVFHGNIFSDAHAIFSQTTLKGESQGRVNILLAGDSVDDPNHAGADLTDSIMVVSIDTKNNTGFMMSIPRDLFVNIPGLGQQKINAANTVTDFSAPGLPNGGMGQLQQIVQNDLGIPIDYYALIDYGAFKDGVDAVGGITININSTDPRGVYDPGLIPRIPNGSVTLNGTEALGLARSRGDQYGSYGFAASDFTRTMYQREMLVAVAKKADTLGVITNPIRVTGLFDALGNNVWTDLSLQDVLRLAQISKGINLSKLQSLTYSETGTNALLTGYTDPDSGEEALVPTAGIDNFGGLQEYYKQLTSNNPVVQEAPTVVILNASDVVGLAAKEEKILESKGFDVVSIADANNEHPQSMIVDNSNGQKPAAKQSLTQTFSNTSVVTNGTSSTEAQEAQGYTSDFVVILGQNWDGTSTNQ